MNPTQDDIAKFRLTRTLALFLLGLWPLVYLGIAWYIDQKPFNPVAGNDLLVYLLLIVGALQPTLYPMIERFQISAHRRNKNPKATLAGVYLIVNVMKMSLVEAIYLYGLVVYFITRQFDQMLYFYPIGILWTIVYWPRRKRFERFIAKESGVL